MSLQHKTDADRRSLGTMAWLFLSRRSEASWLALLWQIIANGKVIGFPNQFFNDSWVVGLWRADHGGDDVVLVIDDTAVPKKGKHSVGVAAQYASALGKNANCQVLVSLTLARGEVPVMVALRLFLPENWTSDPVCLRRTGVPIEYRVARTKPEIAL